MSSCNSRQSFSEFAYPELTLVTSRTCQGRWLGVVVLMTANWPLIREHVNLVVHVVDNLGPGAYEEISFP
jgi:hypothetical protein